MLDKRARAHVERELQQIEHLLEEYRPLLEAAQTAEPELVERTALGAVLQSFYTGVENIFQTIAKRVDQDMPTGEDWHKELLYQMARSTEYRGPSLSLVTAELLEPYLGFRHVSRHAYSFKLDWNKMRDLIWKLTDVWMQVRSDVRALLDSEG